MIIRAFNPDDVLALQEIHEKYYKHEFTFPDFTKFVCAFVVTQDNGQVISGGGVRNILELIALTDKSLPVRTRYRAISQGIHASLYVADRMGNDQVHAFVQDDIWKEHLINNFGFRSTNGQALVIG